MTYRNRGVFKENEDIAPTLYQNFRLNTRRNLGCLIRTMFLDAKNTWPILLIKILGFLTRTEILGLYCIKISSKTAVKILGYFIRTIFLTQKKKKKTPWPILLVKILGFLRKQRFWAYIFIKKSSKAPVKILGYLIRTMFLTPKTHGLLLLVKILGLLKSIRILGLHRFEILGLAPVKILGYFIRTMFFDAKKPMVYFACQNLGIFKENKDFGPTFYQDVK